MRRILLTSPVFPTSIFLTSIVAIVIVAMPLTLVAQRGSIHITGHSPGFRGGFNRGGFGRGGYYWLPLYDPTLPLYDSAFYDSAYAGYSGYPAPEPRVIVLQQAGAAAPEAASTPAQPLMIELQGDRYVQTSGDTAVAGPSLGRAASQTIDRIPAQPSPRRATTDSAPPRALTVLVFRDGRQQEISAYTIADGVLYASADFYTSGVWSLKIPVSTLNLVDTETANRTRGLQFRVPAAQNEVVVGP